MFDADVSYIDRYEYDFNFDDIIQEKMKEMIEDDAQEQLSVAIEDKIIEEEMKKIAQDIIQEKIAENLEIHNGIMTILESFQRN